jgi:hypothetical protein
MSRLFIDSDHIYESFGRTGMLGDQWSDDAASLSRTMPDRPWVHLGREALRASASTTSGG